MRSEPWLTVLTCFCVAFAAGCGSQDSESAKPANAPPKSQAGGTTTTSELADARAEVEWASGQLMSLRIFEAARRWVWRRRLMEELMESSRAYSRELLRQWREEHQGMGAIGWHPWSDPKFHRQPNYDHR